MLRIQLQRMPELPEVEVTRRILESEIREKQVAEVSVNHPRVVRRQKHPTDFSDRLQERTVQSLRRHGKFLIIELDAGLNWVTHLGMSGRIQMVDNDQPEETHTRTVVRFVGGRELRFVDPRTFGFMTVWTEAELASSTLNRLGPDALTDLPSVREFVGYLRGRTALIKPLLLNQSVVAGVGNIYADESLHLCRVSPLRPGGSLAADEVNRLRIAIRTTLIAAIQQGGTSLEDLAYLLPDGKTGDFLDRLRVYGREGQGCCHCGFAIRRTVIRSRSSFWCPGCQA